MPLPVLRLPTSHNSVCLYSCFHSATIYTVRQILAYRRDYFGRGEGLKLNTTALSSVLYLYVQYKKHSLFTLENPRLTCRQCTLYVHLLTNYVDHERNYRIRFEKMPASREFFPQIFVRLLSQSAFCYTLKIIVQYSNVVNNQRWLFEKNYGHLATANNASTCRSSTASPQTTFAAEMLRSVTSHESYYTPLITEPK